jgi:hypothetical protein
VRLRVGLCTARGRLLVFGATPGGGRQHAASRWGRPAGGGRAAGGVAGWACLGLLGRSVSLTQHAPRSLTQNSKTRASCRSQYEDQQKMAEQSA